MEISSDSELIASLQQENSILKLSFQGEKVGLWRWDINDQLFFWCEHMFAIYQLEQNVFLGEYQDWLACVHSEDREYADSYMRKAIDQHIGFEITFRIVCPNGELRYLHSVANVYRDSKGIALKIVGTSRDVSEQQYCRQRLEEAIHGSEKFGHLASHELRAPLRSVKQIAGWILDEVGDVDEEVAENFVLMCSRIERMEHLVEGLLEYACAERDDEVNSSTNMRELVDDIVASLDKPKGMTLDLQVKNELVSLPQKSIRQVLRHLISNAIKHNGGKPAVITVSMEEGESEYQFAVADQGPGIPEALRDQIFDMFQTLKPKDQVEGSGIGLALVKKVVKNYGGAVWLNSFNEPVDDECVPPPTGSTFYFTWPKRNELPS